MATHSPFYTVRLTFCKAFTVPPEYILEISFISSNAILFLQKTFYSPFKTNAGSTSVALFIGSRQASAVIATETTIVSGIKSG